MPSLRGVVVCQKILKNKMQVVKNNIIRYLLNAPNSTFAQINSKH
uniref:Uncharacterized protein n=1 Tax=Anguilla anguilla TaxID=7936 RepID=A0A0E9QHR8_ANGAN